VRMISWACGRTSIGYTRPQIRVALPATGDLRAERTRGPGVHDVGVAHEAAGNSALVLGEAVRCIAGRIDRQGGPRRGEDAS
jgi:hypothetical protein